MPLETRGKGYGRTIERMEQESSQLPNLPEKFITPIITVNDLDHISAHYTCDLDSTVTVQFSNNGSTFATTEKLIVDAGLNIHHEFLVKGMYLRVMFEKNMAEPGGLFSHYAYGTRQ